MTFFVVVCYWLKSFCGFKYKFYSVAVVVIHTYFFSVLLIRLQRIIGIVLYTLIWIVPFFRLFVCLFSSQYAYETYCVYCFIRYKLLFWMLDLYNFLFRFKSIFKQFSFARVFYYLIFFHIRLILIVFWSAEKKIVFISIKFVLLLRFY